MVMAKLIIQYIIHKICILISLLHFRTYTQRGLQKSTQRVKNPWVESLHPSSLKKPKEDQLGCHKLLEVRLGRPGRFCDVLLHPCTPAFCVLVLHLAPCILCTETLISKSYLGSAHYEC
uniref:Tubulin beta-1 chain 2 n=1 Tax=Pararge aegeria TaxID=116150 RepID=S4NX24_9NEOP